MINVSTIPSALFTNSSTVMYRKSETEGRKKKDFFFINFMEYFSIYFKMCDAEMYIQFNGNYNVFRNCEIMLSVFIK